MTLTELSQLHYLQKEIAHDEERIRMIREQACSTAVSTDGMPKTSSGRSKVAYAGESIADLETMIKRRQELCILEEKRIRQYIDSIEDSRTRLIFTCRFCDLMTWNQVADVIGGNNTEDSVKKTVYRHLKRE